MCEAVEKIVYEETKRVEERIIIFTVRNASISFGVSTEEAAEKLGFGVAAYEAAKQNQNMTL